CAQSSMLKIWSNAVAYVNRIEVDVVQKKILALLKIDYTQLYDKDHFKVDSQVAQYKNMREFDSFKATLIMMERKRILAGIRISELNTEMAKHKAAIRRRIL